MPSACCCGWCFSITQTEMKPAGRGASCARGTLALHEHGKHAHRVDDAVVPGKLPDGAAGGDVPQEYLAVSAAGCKPGIDETDRCQLPIRSYLV